MSVAINRLGTLDTVDCLAALAMTKRKRQHAIP